jgi:AmmeMemoRadiSam system protein A
VVAWARGEELPPRPDIPDLPRAGVFVTLYRRGELRGCIGHLEGSRPLVELVQDMAVAAARDDPRFPVVAADELDDITVEVSFMTPPVPARPEEVVPGRHGVIVRRGRSQGVLLPKVAAEMGWSREQLLEGVCRKAGLPTGAWREAPTRLEVFEAQVVGAPAPT